MDFPVAESGVIAGTDSPLKKLASYGWQGRGFEFRCLQTDEEWQEAESLRLYDHSRRPLVKKNMVLVHNRPWRGTVFGLFSTRQELLCCFSLTILGKNVKSQTEELFRAEDFLGLPGQKIELSEFYKSNHILFSQLDRPLLQVLTGLSEQFEISQIACLVPLYGVDLAELAALYRMMALEKRISKKFFCLPRESARVVELYNALRSLRPSASSTQEEILGRQAESLQTLFKWGAQIGGEPAYDADIKQYCFLLNIEPKNLVRMAQRRSAAKLSITA